MLKCLRRDSVGANWDVARYHHHLKTSHVPKKVSEQVFEYQNDETVSGAQFFTLTGIIIITRRQPFKFQRKLFEFNATRQCWGPVGRKVQHSVILL